MTNFEKSETFVQGCLAELHVRTDVEEEKIKALIKMDKAFKRLADKMHHIISTSYMDTKNKLEL